MDMAKKESNGCSTKLGFIIALIAIITSAAGWGISWKSLDSKADAAKTLAAENAKVAEKASDASQIRDEKLDKRIIELEKAVARYELFMIQNNKDHERILSSLERLYNKQASAKKAEQDFTP